MIDIDRLEANQVDLRERYRNATPFPHLILDGFFDERKLSELVDHLPAPEASSKSRDYIFAKNKFESSNFAKFGPLAEEYFESMVSDRFQAFLSFLEGRELFVDKKMHGGGLHQGGRDSFLDMHVDFNYHPLQAKWFRSMNLLLYLNRNWKPEYGGQLKLRHGETSLEAEVEPLFNRLVIMRTGSYTFHGYDRTSFPKGTYRTSLASYAYTLHAENIESPRTTQWNPSRNLPKWLLSRIVPSMVKVKNKFFGSNTARNYRE